MDLNVSKEDLGLLEHPVFEAKEVVEFVCLEAEENAQWGTLSLKCKIQSGKFKGRRYSIRVDLKADREIARIRRARFALAFWKPEEIASGTVNPARLVGRRFTAMAQQAREWNGKTLQDMDFFKDLGATDADPQPPVTKQLSTAHTDRSETAPQKSDLDDIPF
jgi:hypothetical protein